MALAMVDAQPAPPLIPLADAGELEIRKESWKEHVHELVAAAGPVARIDYSAWSGRARAESAAGTWGFSRVKGFRSSHVEVTDGAAGTEVARFDKKTWTRGGRLELGGSSYELHAKGWLRTSWRWEHDGASLVEVDLPGSFGKRKGTARVTEAGRSDPNASLLLLLTLHVHTSDEFAAAGAGAAAAGGAGAS